MLEKSAIDDRVKEAYEAEGYLHANGTRDRRAVLQRQAQVLAEKPVDNKRERPLKSVTKSSQVSGVFPSFPDPDAWGDDSRELLEAAYRVLSARLWAETRPHEKSALQQVITERMGNGFIVCRTKVGKDLIPAAYISDDRGCCDEDYLAPMTSKVGNFAENLSKCTQMLIRRQPGNAEYYARQMKSTFAAIEGRMKADMTKAIESSKNGGGANVAQAGDAEGDDE